jgi:hypothetical protein
MGCDAVLLGFFDVSEKATAFKFNISGFTKAGILLIGYSSVSKKYNAPLFVILKIHIYFLYALIFFKRDEVTGEWSRLHNKELYALYSSPNIIRVMK